MPATGDPQLGEAFEDALAYAVRAHRGQRRKGSGAPYAAHLLAVSALVLEHGGDEETAIAALLHDAAEDQGGEERLAEIEERFGARVADTVAEVSDTFETPKPDWHERKTAYLEHLPEARPEALMVSVADKLHNARSTLQDHREQGEALWSMFTTGSAEDQLWYYRGLVDAFREAERRDEVGEGFVRLLARLERVVDELEARVAAADGG